MSCQQHLLCNTHKKVRREKAGTIIIKSSTLQHYIHTPGVDYYSGKVEKRYHKGCNKAHRQRINPDYTY